MMYKCFAPIPLLLCLTLAATAAEPVNIDQRFAALRKSPLELYAFLYKMPKGADLHNHLSGAIYAEDFLTAAIEEHLCIDKVALALSACGPSWWRPPLSRQITRFAMRLSTLFRCVISCRASNPATTTSSTLSICSAQLAAQSDRGRGPPCRRSERILHGIDGALRRWPYLKPRQDRWPHRRFRSHPKAARSSRIARLVKALSTRVDQMERTRVDKLGCEQTPDATGCRVEIRYVYQVLRESPKEQIFAQVMAGFAAAAADLASWPSISCRPKMGTTRCTITISI